MINNIHKNTVEKVNIFINPKGKPISNWNTMITIQGSIIFILFPLHKCLLYTKASLNFTFLEKYRGKKYSVDKVIQIIQEIAIRNITIRKIVENILAASPPERKKTTENPAKSAINKIKAK